MNEFGAYKIDCTIQFTFVFCGKNPGVNIYNKKDKKLIMTLRPEPSDIRGRVCSVSAENIDAEKIMYLYEWDGKEYPDPYSVHIIGRKTWGNPEEKVFSAVSFREKAEISQRPVLSELIIYRAHIRGLTMDKRISEASKGTYKGLLSCIPYFKNLGVNCLSLFPIYEFSENNEGKIDYWGYGGKDIFPMAPKASYFGDDPVGNAVFMVNTLHNNGIYTIIDFCFNKNNLLNIDLILSALRFWAFEIGVDGFRFLGDAVPVSEIKKDPFLAEKILIFENLSGDETKEDKERLLVYDDEFLYSVRRLINHMDENAPGVTALMRRQGQNFSFINFVSAPNGFTLYDCVSYRDKHNEDNGEENRDGSNYNYSDNCGVEGDSRDKNVLAERLKRIRSALMILMLSQSVPMINAGDEFLNSQQGNNNPYCQDNKTGWVNYTRKKDALALTEYFKSLCAFRKAHPAIRAQLPFKMNDYKKAGIPDLSYHSREPWAAYLDESKKAVGILISGEYPEDSHEDVMILINYHNAKEQFTLPTLPGKNWYLLNNTGDFIFDMRGKRVGNKKTVTVPGDTVSLLVAR